MNRRVKAKDWAEEEANYFAMHLLVPTPLLSAELGPNFVLDLTDDKRIKELASLFGVSVTVMLFRVLEVCKKQ